MATEPDLEILSLKRVSEITGYCRANIYVKAGNPDDSFPAPLKLSANKIGWLKHEIQAWLASRPRVSYAPQSQTQGEASAAA